MGNKMNNVTLLKMIMIQSSGTLVNPIPALQSLDTKGKVVYISTFSKSYLAVELHILFYQKKYYQNINKEN